MKSAVETLNPTRVKLTVEVPYDELKPSLDAAYASIASQVTVPGFRKGKVPPRIIDQRFGRGAVIEEAVNDALPKFYLQAVQESEVRPLGQPQVDVTGVPDSAGSGDLTFTAEVDVRPEITLPDLTAPEVTVDDATVSEEDVDKRLDDLRQRFGTLAGVDRPVRTGDFVTLDLTAEIDGEEIDTVKGISYEVGSGQMLAGMDDVLPDMSAGETTTFEAPLAGGDREGQDSQVTLTVDSVKERQLPEANDDFAQLASEFDTLDELRADLRTQAEQLARYQQGLQARERLLEQLMDAVEIPVPEGLITDEVTRHLEQEGKQPDDEHGVEVAEDARKAFKSQLLLDALAEQESVSVGQQELVEYLVQNAAEYRMDPNEFAKTLDEAGQIPAVVAEVARRKALAVVLERAAVKDASGETVDLAALFGPPEPAEGEEAEPAGDEAAEQTPAAAAPARPTGADPAALPTLNL